MAGPYRASHRLRPTYPMTESPEPPPPCPPAPGTSRRRRPDRPCPSSGCTRRGGGRAGRHRPARPPARAQPGPPVSGGRDVAGPGNLRARRTGRRWRPPRCSPGDRPDHVPRGHLGHRLAPARGGRRPRPRRRPATGPRPSTHRALHLPAATSAPAPAPPAVATAAPLQSHEVFGYAPYWTLPQSSGLRLTDLTTLAYFSVDANADGTLDQSGAGMERLPEPGPGRPGHPGRTPPATGSC